MSRGWYDGTREREVGTVIVFTMLVAPVVLFLFVLFWPWSFPGVVVLGAAAADWRHRQRLREMDTRKP